MSKKEKRKAKAAAAPKGGYLDADGKTCKVSVDCIRAALSSSVHLPSPFQPCAGVWGAVRVAVPAVQARGGHWACRTQAVELQLFIQRTTVFKEEHKPIMRPPLKVSAKAPC